METRVARRRLGRTGLEVSEVSFGAMNLRKCESSAQARDTLRYVLDAGINLIDTARAYNGENPQGELVESERYVGEAIRSKKDLDEPIIVVTKGHGYTPDALNEELSTSLRALGVEGEGDLRIGDNPIHLVYLFHGITDERWGAMESSAVLDVARELRDRGKVDFLGFSSHYAQGKEINAALDTGVFDVVELPYNVFNRDLVEGEAGDLFRKAHEMDLGIINMKAFSGNGFVEIHRILRDYVSIDYAAMLRYCLRNACVSTIDAGAKYASEFVADIEAAAMGPLTEQEARALEVEADTVAPVMKNICRECMHCQEKFTCPHGVDFPGILSAYSRFLVGRHLGQDTGEAAEAYRKLQGDAEECIECAECLPWCEYKLDVPKMIKEAQAALGP